MLTHGNVSVHSSGKDHSSTFQALSCFLTPKPQVFGLAKILLWSSTAHPKNYKSCWMEIKAVFHTQIWKTGFTANERATSQQPLQSPKDRSSSTPSILTLQSCGSPEQRLSVMLKYTKLPGGCDMENLLSAGHRGECLISMSHQAVPAPLSA